MTTKPLACSACLGGILALLGTCGFPFRTPPLTLEEQAAGTEVEEQRRAWAGLEEQLARYDLRLTGVPSCDAVLALWVECAPKLEAWGGRQVEQPVFVSGPQPADARTRESLSGGCGSMLGALSKGWGPICFR